MTLRPKAPSKETSTSQYLTHKILADYPVRLSFTQFGLFTSAATLANMALSTPDNHVSSQPPSSPSSSSSCFSTEPQQNETDVNYSQPSGPLIPLMMLHAALPSELDISLHLSELYSIMDFISVASSSFGTPRKTIDEYFTTEWEKIATERKLLLDEKITIKQIGIKYESKPAQFGRSFTRSPSDNVQYLLRRKDEIIVPIN